jgi:7-keto-8-aminopelargonate synthetase-like enzyme
MIVSASLSKTFGAGGGLLICPDESTRKRLLRTGGTLTFGGPVQTAELAAGVAAAEILLSDEHPELQRQLRERFDVVITASARAGVRLAATDPTPVWFAEIGRLDQAIEVALALREAGFLANVSGYPVVPQGRAGIRFTTTLAQTTAQLTGFVEAIAEFTAETTTIEIDLTDPEVVAAGS